MLQDLATLAPSAIVCAAFLVGVVMLVRHEMAPKREASENTPENAEADPADDAAVESREHSEP